MSDSEDSTVTYTTAPPSPVYIPCVLEPEYPEYIPPEDEVFPAEEQPLPAAASPTTDSPGYIPESDLDEDLKDDDDEDPEEDPADYLADHDDDDEEEEPFGDDADKEDDEQDEGDDDKEEEHPASVDSIPPPPALCVMARISFRTQPPTLFFTKEEAERFLAMPIPPSSPLTLLSSPLPQIPSPLIPASPPILPIPLPTASLPLQLLSFDRRSDRPEVTLPPRKRLSIVHCPGYEVGESSAAAAARPIEEDIGYGIRDTWIDLRDVAEEEALTTLEEGRQTEIFQRVEALVDDSQYHYETSRLVDQEAIVSRESWAHSIGLSSEVHFELQGYMTHTWVQDQRVDAHDTLIATLTTQLSSLQGHPVMALGEIQALQAREKARAASTKMAPKRAAPRRTTRLKPGATSNPNQAPSTTTTTVTNAQLQSMIDQGVNAALAACDVNRTGDDSHTSGTGVRRTEREFSLLCVRTYLEESDWVERYIGGLPDSIHGSVAASKPKTMQEANKMATGLMDKKIRTYVERQAANKRKFEDTSRNNQSRQQPPKRQDVARAHATGSRNR
nr:hypothetical protein [Tanacetum cinerariifolium]